VVVVVVMMVLLLLLLLLLPVLLVPTRYSFVLYFSSPLRVVVLSPLKLLIFLVSLVVVKWPGPMPQLFSSETIEQSLSMHDNSNGQQR